MDFFRSLLLPLPSAISNIICESDLSHIAWRPRIAAIIILSIGTPDQKLSAIRSLVSRCQEPLDNEYRFYHMLAESCSFLTYSFCIAVWLTERG